MRLDVHVAGHGCLWIIGARARGLRHRNPWDIAGVELLILPVLLAVPALVLSLGGLFFRE